ncbi:hypothetical protein EJ05DRAFT_15870 [Pseudovirgaria hyperparasitica]|uniref:Uncharacterized protein n=1 Tax=Pseudovirgaria hyperparasitica TaxID=470096 RepID=A0A6A6WKV8_9PEZI|nr:uncharacterized protein EJ05DRAFT_15870 [Pseudovirgaria hyperparasitica]KAF2762802.1 hypothetical protein EJ05DRAFT_15870 [Pseudovirgaria hyperparasitica]
MHRRDEPSLATHPSSQLSDSYPVDNTESPSRRQSLVCAILYKRPCSFTYTFPPLVRLSSCHVCCCVCAYRRCGMAGIPGLTMIFSSTVYPLFLRQTDRQTDRQISCHKVLSEMLVVVSSRLLVNSRRTLLRYMRHQHSLPNMLLSTPTMTLTISNHPSIHF